MSHPNWKCEQTWSLNVQLGSCTPRSVWLFSWPLLAGTYAFLLALYAGHFIGMMFIDGDTYWHITTGRWIIQNGAIPFEDPFSHTMRGGPWVAKEWLSQIVLSTSHDLGGWNGVIAVTTLAFGTTFGLLTRALMRTLEPLRAILFVAVGVLMVFFHLLARPFLLAMPLMMIWMIELFRASDDQRAPRLQFLPVMILWANMHSGFTLGIAFAGALALEAAIGAWGTPRLAGIVRSWGMFLLLAIMCALFTPQGIHGFWFTWQVMVQDTFALNRIGEWASPDFHQFQPLELWLLGGLLVVMYQGLRLPLTRLLLLLGLLHLALKHTRNVELVGLIGPLIVAKPLALQWQAKTKATGNQSLGKDDLFLRKLAQPAGTAASIACLVLLVGSVLLIGRVKPAALPSFVVPAHAIEAARNAHLSGPVLNEYGFGGPLIYYGIPPFIDGRQDLYRDKFMKSYLDALRLAQPRALQELLERSRIEWTLLRPGTPAISLLDVLPGWRRIYTDENAVLHVRERAAHPVTTGPNS